MVKLIDGTDMVSAGKGFFFASPRRLDDLHTNGSLATSDLGQVYFRLVLQSAGCMVSIHNLP